MTGIGILVLMTMTPDERAVCEEQDYKRKVAAFSHCLWYRSWEFHGHSAAIKEELQSLPREDTTRPHGGWFAHGDLLNTE